MLAPVGGWVRGGGHARDGNGRGAGFIGTFTSCRREAALSESVPRFMIEGASDHGQ